MPLDENQIASRDQFERQSRNYGKSHILADVSDLAEAIGGLEISRGGRALDVATGGGHTAVWLAEQGWEVTASDLSPAMLERASELAAGHGMTIATALHEAEKLPYPDGTFRAVSCRVAAHHFTDQAGFVREAARVLAPGGVFLLIDGSVPDGEPEAEAWIHAVEKFRDPSHGKFLSPESWTRLAGEAHLNVLRCTTTPFKQPDLEWYFETAGTTEENRAKIHALIAAAPESAKRVFRLAQEPDGNITWWWPRLMLVAAK